MEKMQESINKDLEELKNKHTETKAQSLKFKIHQKELIAQYLKQKNEEKKKGYEKNFERLQLKTSPTWKRKQSIKSKGLTESHTGSTQGETC